MNRHLGNEDYFEIDSITVQSEPTATIGDEMLLELFNYMIAELKKRLHDREQADAEAKKAQFSNKQHTRGGGGLDRGEGA